MTLAETWGRFTARGGADVEAAITAIVERAGRLVEENLPKDSYRALVLLGGYGRGEGGVERRGSVEHPHNNLDLLLITSLRGGLAQAALARRVVELTRPLVAEGGVEIDVSAINAWKLRTSPCLVIWYDMRFGHKTVAGDAAFIPSLHRFRSEAIEPADVLNLLVNRATLLVINDLLLARGARSLTDRRTIVKHAMKAIIGYGDAYLFARDDYSFSYVEKQRRMRARRDVPASLRTLYDEAIEFRFEPSYADYLERDLGAWMAHLREALAPIHLFCESHRLGAPGLTFRTYTEKALRHALLEAPLAPRALARKGRNLLRSLRSSGAPSGEAPLLDLALRCNGPKANLAIVSPAVLYRGCDAGLTGLARRVLGASGGDHLELEKAYLRSWSEHGDSNFVAVAEALGLSLSPSDHASSKESP